ncbi:TPA: hypothetical protein NKZ56_004449 [Vibrio parahaemolyticus]|nr:hypothetical protein [Vibrio parahaemolyticus]
MDRKKKVQSVIDSLLERQFYFLGHPDRTDDGIWKDENGNVMSMDQMDEVHLKSSIKVVKNAILRISSRPKEVQDFLIPLAESKISELESALNK